MAEKFKNMETAIIHAGYDAKEHLGSLTPLFFKPLLLHLTAPNRGSSALREKKRDLFIPDLAIPQ